MSVILRWFNDNGERHRVWYRNLDTDEQQLMVAGPDGEFALDGVLERPLHELSDSDLSELARRAQNAGSFSDGLPIRMSLD